MAVFKREVSALIGINLDDYKDNQIERRINALMARANAPDPETYLMLLRSDPQSLKEFIDGLTINVSEWFRNVEHFEALERQILPGLLETFGDLEIWSAGCSIGSEIYSVAILLDRLGALSRCYLRGTDIDDRALDQARSGLYRPHEQKGLEPGLVRAYFDEEPGGTLRLRRAIAERVAFEKQNLVTDPPRTGCHLVLCRNVVIYLAGASKQQVHRALAHALVRGGILFVGSTERISGYREMGFEQVRSFFYEKA